MGHLHPGCAKDVVVTMKSGVPINLKKMGVKCKVSKIMFPLPADQVPDWDDRMRDGQVGGRAQRNTPGTFTTKRKVSRGTKPLVWPGLRLDAYLVIFSVSSFFLLSWKKKQSPITWPGFPKRHTELPKHASCHPLHTTQTTSFTGRAFVYVSVYSF